MMNIGSMSDHNSNNSSNNRCNNRSNKSNCLGVVLAGGLSSRMGQNKALLTRHNTSMLEFSKQLLLESGVNQVVISGNNNVIHEQQQVNDVINQAGPVGGIYSVIKQYQPSALLVLPVDLPLITSKALAKLKQIGEMSHKACCYQNHSIPLYLPVNAYVEMFLQQVFSSESFGKKHDRGPSIKSLLAQIPHQAIPLTNQQLLFNTNTPEQWQQAQEVFNNMPEQSNLGSL